MTTRALPGLVEVQAFMLDRRIDGWLVYDFRGSNAVFKRLLPSERDRHTTRRAMLFIPARGEPRLAVSVLDAGQFVGAGVAADAYVGWTELFSWMRARLGGCTRVAMEYSPGGALPLMSIADAGTVELVRSFGVEVCSSADLVQVSVARWGAAAVSEHRRASELVDRIKDEAFGVIGEAIRGGRTIHEHEVAQFIRDRFAAEGLQWPDGPIVAVNEHAGDPHYEPSAARATPIRRGDWILIDLWARVPGDHNIHSDITWTGYAGDRTPPEHRRVFDAVARARDAALDAARHAWREGRAIRGWQLDDAAREVLLAAELGPHIRHRTGHSLSPGAMVHGVGMNLDNLETHDTRVMLPDTGFTIEPGAYLPHFGVRSEINVYVDPKDGPVVTSMIQREPVLVG